MKYVVARDYREAEDFARTREWSKLEWRYIDRPYQLRGLLEAHVYVVGYRRNSQQRWEIDAELRARQATGMVTVEEVRDWR